MEKIKELLKDKPLWVKAIIIAAIAIIVFFTQACSLKADKVYFENPNLEFGKKNSVWARNN